MVRVGLVGCGTIGLQLALALQRRYPSAARITALHDTDPTRAGLLQRRLTPRPPVLSLPALIRSSQLVIEAASVDAALAVLRQAFGRRSLDSPRRRRGSLGMSPHRQTGGAPKDVFIMSVGALLRDRTWATRARRAGARVYVPSGALAGLDGIKAMSVGTVKRVTLTTRKPPRALASAPYVRRKQLHLDRLTKPSTIFAGAPRAVITAFPQNANVAAALAIAAGAAGRRARIRVVADPAIRANIHELDVEGDCGRIRCRIESRPSANPKTSELAVRSAVATLQRIFDPISIGT